MLQETGPRTGQVLEDAAYIDLRGFDGDAVDLSEINWLSQAEFHRHGPDLVIESPSGEKIFLVGYYESETPPDLSGLGGANIPAHIVDILSGPRAPGQFAQANGAVASEPIGQVETAEGTVFAVRVDGTRVQLKVGDPIYQGDTLETAEDGIVGVTFVDNSTLSLDEDGRMVIDELVYDPGTQDGSASMFVLQGAMSFVSGQLAKANPDAMQIETPVATIGIRGTSILLSAVPPEPGDDRPPKIAVALVPEGGLDGQTFVGEAVVVTQGGTQVIGGGFQAVTVDNPNAPPSSPVTVSLTEIGNVFGNALSANPNRGAVPDNVREAVDKIVAHKKATERKAELEAQLEEAKANGEDTSELEADLQEATEAEQETKQVAEGAIEQVAQELGNPDLAVESNLTGKNEPVDNGNDGDKPDEPVQTPPDPPAPVNDPPPPPGPVTPPVPPGPEVPPVPPKQEIGKKKEDPQVVEEEIPNIAPTANDDVIQTSEGVYKEFFAAALLGNDTDPENNTLRLTHIDGRPVENGTPWGSALSFDHGTLDFDGSKFTYTPYSATTGTDEIEYGISDGKGGEATAYVSFTITENDAPVVGSVSLPDGVEYNIYTLSESQLLANASDADGDALSVTSVTGGANLAITDNGDGTWTVTSSEEGLETINFTVSDGLNEVTQSSSINFNDVDNVATNDGITLQEDASQIIDVLSNDDLADGLTDLSIASGPANGVAVVNGDNTVTYTPDANYNGTDSFTYIVTDEDGTTTTATVNLTVDPVNDVPVFENPSVMAFDGVDDTIDLQDDQLNNMPSGTIAAWVKVSDIGDGTSGSGSALTVNQLDFTNTTNLFGVGMNDGSNIVASAGQVVFFAQNGVGFYSNSTIEADTWVHLAVSFDASGATLYIDGLPDKTVSGDFSVPDLPLSAGGYDLDPRIGGVHSSGSYTYPFDGRLDNIGVWDTRLSDADIANIASNGADPVNDSDLRFYYDLSDGVATDETGNGWDGTLSGPANVVDAFVLENDSFSGQATATDVETADASLVFSLGAAATNGTATVNPDGSYTYTPNADYWGEDSFTITVDDGTGGTTQQTVNVFVDMQAETVVNAEATGVAPHSSYHGNVTALSDGGWIVTWYDADAVGVGRGVMAQRYDSSGNVTKSAFQVSSVGTRVEPTVLELSNGDFIFAYSLDAGGNSTTGVYYTRFDPALTAVGSEVKVESASNNYYGQPELVDLGGGSFGIAYRLETALPNYSDVYYREFDAQDTGGTEHFVNSNNTNQHQTEQDIAIHGDNVMVVWAETSGTITNGIYARVYDRTTGSETWGTDFSVELNGVERNPRVTALTDGNFVVVWEQSDDIYGRVIQPDGTSVSHFLVNGVMTGTQERPEIVGLSDGNFAVVWHGQGDNAADTADYGVFVSVFDATGNEVIGETLVNDTVTGDQKFPMIDQLANGDLIVSWQDASADPSNAAVTIKRLSYDGSKLEEVCVDGTNSDPIVLDLDGDGVELTSAADGVAFDVNADGDKEQIGWVGADDGVLAFDVNQDGQINDMSEIISHYFSYQDRNSEGLESSLEVLALYDDNGDNVIDAEDEIYEGLSLWQDANSDGITDEGELRTLSDEGIQSINLDYTALDDGLNGNLITKSGTAMFDTGEALSWNEVAFELDEAALLKEIVGTEQDVDTSVLPSDDTTAPTLEVTSSQAEGTGNTAVSEQDSYTTTDVMEDSVVLPAAE